MRIKIRRKIKLDTRVKIGFVAILVCTIIFSGIKIYQEKTANKVIQEDQVLYQYMSQPKAEYIVHIKENKIYEGTVQEEGIDYSKLLLDYIEVKFGTEFQGSKKADVEFDYQITAKVMGYKNGAEGKVVNWSKDYQLAEQKQVLTSETYFNEDATVKLNIEDYDEFAKEASTITGMELSSEVLVSMDGNLYVKTENGELRTPINASITIPLLQEVYNISKSSIPSISDSITGVTEKPVPINQKVITLFWILIVGCIIGILVIILTTEAPNAYDIVKAKSKRIIKDYGSRMIALLSKTEQNYQQTYELNSMEDLIKVADEIQRPIYYLQDSTNVIGDFKLQVVDGDNLYLYHII